MARKLLDGLLVACLVCGVAACAAPRGALPVAQPPLPTPLPTVDRPAIQAQLGRAGTLQEAVEQCVRALRSRPDAALVRIQEPESGHT